MIKDEKKQEALKSLQSVIIKARTMAYEQAEHSRIAGILDGTEYLAALICEKEDKTDTFRNYIADMAKEYNCCDALEKFDGVS